MYRIVYRVYEVSRECRNGKTVRKFKTEKGAQNATAKSIYRFYKPVKVVEFTL